MPAAYAEDVSAPTARAHALDSFVDQLARTRRARRRRRAISRKCEQLAGQIDARGRRLLDSVLTLLNDRHVEYVDALFDYAFDLGREAGAAERLRPIRPLRRRRTARCNATRRMSR